MDDTLNENQRALLQYAQSRGYTSPNFDRFTSGRGRKPVDLDVLIRELILAGHPIEEAWSVNTPFFGDPHPTNPHLLMWSFSEAGTPNYIHRTDWIRLARQALARLRRASEPSRRTKREIADAFRAIDRVKEKIKAETQVFPLRLQKMETDHNRRTLLHQSRIAHLKAQLEAEEQAYAYEVRAAQHRSEDAHADLERTLRNLNSRLAELQSRIPEEFNP